MKIAHIVTYVSADGAFGGPTRVALGQAAALAARGHDVTVYAGAPLHEAGESERDGYRLKAFRARSLLGRRGFAAMSSPGMLRALSRELGSTDVVHVHFARDLVVAPAASLARRRGVPYVLQPHGMIRADDRLVLRMFDRFAIRPTLRDAKAVLALTSEETDQLATIQPGVRVELIRNGVQISDDIPDPSPAKRILFLARLHERKRPLAFVEMARILAPELPEYDFLLAGPDEGEGEAVRQAIRESGYSDRILWIGSVSPEETDNLMASAMVYVLPARNEVFPMTILESFRVGTPVVTTNSLGIADACIAFGAALVTSGEPTELASAVRDVVQDANLAARLRHGGKRYLKEQLDIEPIAKQLETLYMSKWR